MSANLLETKHLSMTFGGLKAVDQVNLEIPSGVLYGLIGPNGAGKTTFFNLFNCCDLNHFLNLHQHTRSAYQSRHASTAMEVSSSISGANGRRRRAAYASAVPQRRLTPAQPPPDPDRLHTPASKELRSAPAPTLHRCRLVECRAPTPEERSYLPRAQHGAQAPAC